MRRLVSSGVLATSLAALLSGPASAQQTIPIAAIGPMTGQYASFGAQFKLGAEAAVADINAAGGVNGKKLQEGALNRVSALVRAYDPCLSCSTHALGMVPLQLQLLGADGELLDEKVTE